MEAKLEQNILTTEYIVNCIAKNEKKINDLAYKRKVYEHVQEDYTQTKKKLNELIEYRQPFIDVLIHDYKLSLDDIKNLVANVKTKNIPTKEVCNRIRDIITSGYYLLE